MKIRQYVLRTALSMLLVLLIFSYIINRITEPQQNRQNSTAEISIAWVNNDSNFSSAMNQLIENFQLKEPTYRITQTTLTQPPFMENEWRKLYLADSWPDLMEVSDLSFSKNLHLIRPVPKDWESLLQKSFRNHKSDEAWLLPIQSADDSRYLRIYFNKALFDSYHLKAPTNYADLMLLCQKLSQVGTQPFGIAGTINCSLRDLFLLHLGEFIHQRPNFYQELAAGTTEIDADYMALFDKIKTLVTKYGNEDWTALTDNGLIQEFNAGRIAMIFTDQRIYNQVEESPYVKLGSFMFPSDTMNHSYVIEGAFKRGWVISANALADIKKKEALSKFINYYYSSESHKIFRDNNSFPPPGKDLQLVSTQQPDRSILQLEVSDQQADHTLLQLPFAEIPYLFTFFSNQTILLNQYLTDTISIDELHNKLVETWNILNKEETS